jgi:lysophospholipid acyltransferase (LPLAT)-like uncharacterized protein
MKDYCEAQRWFYGIGDRCKNPAPFREVETTIEGEMVTLTLCETDAKWVEDWDKKQLEENQKEAWEEA